MMTASQKSEQVWAARETLSAARKAYRAAQTPENAATVLRLAAALETLKGEPAEAPVHRHVDTDVHFMGCCSHATKRADSAPYIAIIDCPVHGTKHVGTAD